MWYFTPLHIEGPVKAAMGKPILSTVDTAEAIANFTPVERLPFCFFLYHLYFNPQVFLNFPAIVFATVNHKKIKPRLTNMSH